MDWKGNWTLNNETVMYGVFGDPIKHSRSPLMMNRAFRETGLNAAYAAFQVKPQDLGEAIRGVRALGFRGINVTIPHKVEIIPYLDELSDAAKRIGAVNTVVQEEGRLIGRNTDGIGFVRSLKEEAGFFPQGRTVLLIGAGGAARGVAYALASEGPKQMWIANRTVRKAQDLAAELSAFADCRGIGLEDIRECGFPDLVVNTTQVGMHPNEAELPLDAGLLRAGMTVSDIVYNPLKTRLLTEAERRGCRIHSGLGMFIYQGVYAFEYWTGKQAPVQAMREVVERSLEG